MNDYDMSDDTKSGLPIWAKILLVLVVIAAIVAAVIIVKKKKKARAASLLEDELQTASVTMPRKITESNMNFLDLLTMSVNNLWRRKLRTFLTVLGVIIGTASIVVMISLGMGMNKANMEQIEKYGGLTTINVYANENGSSTYYGSEMAVSDGGVSGSGKNEPVRLDDAMIETLKNIPHVSFVSPMLTMSVVAKQGAYICSYLNVVAMEPEAFTQMNIKVGTGIAAPGRRSGAEVFLWQYGSNQFHE